ncbi:MAG: helix-turn-helix domain-containing protein [Verrucomicrobiae bacterium]|nr:helix-turn-helix domain-containing protein [Verrucomicrobiae bacterium]NNJ87563.1 helix-turn-helix domain-containing protein [Akkermansiaceae bacterium]
MMTLRELRKQQGLTQAELAEKAGLRQATLSAIENGRSRPHAGTVRALAEVLNVDIERLQSVVSRAQQDISGGDMAGVIEQMGNDWKFLDGLDSDLRAGLVKSLVAEWTHSSTAIEGNTITAGDTLFVLTEGLTVSGKSLREHQELHGHAHALGLMSAWVREGKPVRIESLHTLQRAVQTGTVVDSLAPLGAWKVEANGTMAITTDGTTSWHEYARPGHVVELVEMWLNSLAQSQRKLGAGLKNGMSDDAIQSELLNAYTDTHLGFVAIHPYADGNGRMARLLANVPLLRAGYPPLLVSSKQRREYIALLGDYSIFRGQPWPNEPLVSNGSERDALHDFFGEQWDETLQLVEQFHQRQTARGG